MNFDIERTDEEVKAFRENLHMHLDNLSRESKQTQWSSMTYEQGLRDLMDWLMGDVDEAPLDEI